MPPAKKKSPAKKAPAKKAAPAKKTIAKKSPAKKAPAKKSAAKKSAGKKEEKVKRAPSAYNLFMKSELAKVKKANPKLDHKGAFTIAAQNWSKQKK